MTAGTANNPTNAPSSGKPHRFGLARSTLVKREQRFEDRVPAIGFRGIGRTGMRLQNDVGGQQLDRSDSDRKKPGGGKCEHDTLILEQSAQPGM